MTWATDDPGYKLLAVLIAFTAWFWVQSQDTHYQGRAQAPAR